MDRVRSSSNVDGDLNLGLPGPALITTTPHCHTSNISLIRIGMLVFCSAALVQTSSFAQDPKMSVFWSGALVEDRRLMLDPKPGHSVIQSEAAMTSVVPGCPAQIGTVDGYALP